MRIETSRLDARIGPSGGTARRGVLVVALIVACFGAACRQDMQQGPRYDPLVESDFFADRSSARPLVEGTVARGHLNADLAFHTGRDASGYLQEPPLEVNRELLLRGQERFNVYCSPCHGQLGNGRGMAVQRGFKQPPSYHEPRLRGEPVGYFYDVITNGFGAMQDYSAQVVPRDRWAIAAYIRVLQLSQHATVEDVPPAERPRLDEGGSAPAAEGGSAPHD